jgi:hypothetical protein
MPHQSLPPKLRKRLKEEGDLTRPTPEQLREMVERRTRDGAITAGKMKDRFFGEDINDPLVLERKGVRSKPRPPKRRPPDRAEKPPKRRPPKRRPPVEGPPKRRPPKRRPPKMEEPPKRRPPKKRKRSRAEQLLGL